MTTLVHLCTEDADALARLHADAYDDPWSARAFDEALRAPSGFGVGLREGRDILAFVLVQIASETADILQIATHPRHQRRGFARALLTALEADLISRGVTRLTLDVASDNIAALGFYEAAGFARDGVRPRYYVAGRETAVDAILMSKVI